MSNPELAHGFEKGATTAAEVDVTPAPSAIPCPNRTMQVRTLSFFFKRVCDRRTLADGPMPSLPVRDRCGRGKSKLSDTAGNSLV